MEDTQKLRQWLRESETKIAELEAENKLLLQLLAKMNIKPTFDYVNKKITLNEIDKQLIRDGGYANNLEKG